MPRKPPKLFRTACSQPTPDHTLLWRRSSMKRPGVLAETVEAGPGSPCLTSAAARYQETRCQAPSEMPVENEAWKHIKLRSSKYLNNSIEQDHRGIKYRTGPMLGFKNFDCAATTIAGTELLRRIRKGQFVLGASPSQEPNYSCNLECGSRRVVLISSSTLLRPMHKFAPEPVSG